MDVLRSAGGHHIWKNYRIPRNGCLQMSLKGDRLPHSIWLRSRSGALPTSLCDVLLHEVLGLHGATDMLDLMQSSPGGSRCRLLIICGRVRSCLIVKGRKRASCQPRSP